jgi:hypothetical protein
VSESTHTTGTDTFVNSGSPAVEYGAWKQVQVRSGVLETYVRPALPASLKGRTVLAATLSNATIGAWSSQTLTGRLLAAPFTPSTTNWNNRPGVTGPTATVVTGAVADGAEWSMDVKALIQAVADGTTTWRGIRVTTSAATMQRMRSFRHAQPAWTLYVELSDAPEKPSELVPDGIVVGEAKPRLAWDYVDYGDGSGDQTAYQVRIDPLGPAGGTADWDSGEVTSSSTGVDLAGTSYPGFSTVGGSTQWQVRTKGAGEWSDWSDWGSWTYQPRPALTVTSPTGGVITDPTPQIVVSSSAALTAYRVIIADTVAPSVVVQDSLRRDMTGTVITYVPPLRPKGQKRTTFLDGVPSTITVQAWDAYDRDGWAQQVVINATLDDDAAISAPTLVAVVPSAEGLPQMTHTWTRATAPDGWVVTLGGQPYARLDPGDVSVVGTTYTWVDPDYVAGDTDHSWRVRAVEDGEQGLPSNAVVTRTVFTGLWLDAGDGPVCLHGEAGGNWVRRDRASVYRPIGSAFPVVAYEAKEGLSGGFDGELHDEPEVPYATAMQRIRGMLANPAAPVWLLLGREAQQVYLLDLTPSPAPDALEGEERCRVAFTFEPGADPGYG